MHLIAACFSCIIAESCEAACNVAYICNQAPLRAAPNAHKASTCCLMRTDGTFKYCHNHFTGRLPLTSDLPTICILHCWQRAPARSTESRVRFRNNITWSWGNPFISMFTLPQTRPNVFVCLRVLGLCAQTQTLHRCKTMAKMVEAPQNTGLVEASF